jgi:hypothetical protein
MHARSLPRSSNCHSYFVTKVRTSWNAVDHFCTG